MVSDLILFRKVDGRPTCSAHADFYQLEDENNQLRADLEEMTASRAAQDETAEQVHLMSNNLM